MDPDRIQILLVEDNPTDVLIAREGLLGAPLLTTLHVANDGIEALEFLHQRGQHAAAPRPDLIILDLNMPRKNGQEVLAEIKVDDDLMKIPVIILTTSKSQEDITRAYGHHANCYISKPVDFEDFSTVVRTIQQFWFSIVSLPSTKKNGH